MGRETPATFPQNLVRRRSRRQNRLPSRTSRSAMACWRGTKTRDTRRMRRCVKLRCENLARARTHASSVRLPQFCLIWQLDNRENYLHVRHPLHAIAPRCPICEIATCTTHKAPPRRGTRSPNGSAAAVTRSRCSMFRSRPFPDRNNVGGDAGAGSGGRSVVGFGESDWLGGTH